MGKEREMHENLALWFSALNPLLQITCCRGEAVELAGKNDPYFPLVWKQQLYLAKLILMLSTENSNVESNNMFFITFGATCNTVL